MQLIGLDIGTTSIAGLAFDVETSLVRRCLSVSNHASTSASGAFARCQNPDVILRTSIDILRQLIEEDVDTVAIGISSQMHGILYVNDNGDAVTPLVTWQDGRGNERMANGLSYAEYFTLQTGYPSATGYGLVTHYYNLMNHHVPPEASKLVTIGDYVAMRLGSATSPSLHPTHAAGLGCYDVISRSFDLPALRTVSIDDSWLPTVTYRSEPIGLFENTIPVYPAIGDNQSSFYGSVGTNDSTLLVNIGTGAQLSMMVKGALNETPGWELRPFLTETDFLLVGATLSGGKAYALLESFFRDVLSLFGQKRDSELFEEMESILSRHKPLLNRVDISPTFFGTRQNPHQTGRVDHLTATQFTPVHFMDGMLRGIANELYTLLQNIPRVERDRLRNIVASGNALRRSPYFTSVVSEMFDSKVRFAAHEEEAAFGAALYAGTTTGIYPSFAKAAAHISYTQI